MQVSRNQSFFAPAASLLFLGVACLLVGCGQDMTGHKVQQIQEGVENVDRYAKEIEKLSQPSAKP